MSEIIPLHVYPWPITPERDALMRRAKASLTDVDVLIRPTAAAPGAGARVLSFGGPPPFMCSYAPIRQENTTSVESIAAAMRFVLTAPIDDEQPFGDEAWMQGIFGPETKLVRVEAMEPKGAFR